MERYWFIGRRALETVPLGFGILALTLVLLHLSPGDPARVLLGPRAPAAEVEAKRVELGLNEDLPTQYVRYARGVLSGDLGTSIRSNTPVTSVIAERLPVTLWVVGGTMLVTLLLAVPTAILAARRPDGVVDHSVRIISLISFATPAYFVGVLLILLVAIPTGWFPVQGFPPDVAGRIRATALPALTIAIGTAPILVRAMRGSLVETLAADHVVAARTLGWRGTRLMRDHVVRNALPPAITLLAVQLGYLLFSVVIVEQLFALPGLGRGLVNAVATRDYPVVQGTTLVFAALVVLGNLTADAIHAMVDPRIHQ